MDGSSPSGILAPFHDALVPGIRGLGERGFSTALGNLHERIALVVAAPVHAEAHRAHDLAGPLPALARESSRSGFGSWSTAPQRRITSMSASSS